MQMPIDPETSKADGVARLETIADHALPGWRERTTHRLESLANARTGAVDFPGKTGQRLIAAPASIVGDRVAAPGLLSQPEQRCQGCPASSGLTMSINAWQPWASRSVKFRPSWGAAQGDCATSPDAGSAERWSPRQP